MFDEARDTEKHGSRVTVLLDGTIDLQKVGLSVYSGFLQKSVYLQRYVEVVWVGDR